MKSPYPFQIIIFCKMWIALNYVDLESLNFGLFLRLKRKKRVRARLGKNTFMDGSVVAGGNVELHQNVRVTRNILSGGEILAQASP